MAAAVAWRSDGATTESGRRHVVLRAAEEAPHAGGVRGHGELEIVPLDGEVVFVDGFADLKRQGQESTVLLLEIGCPYGLFR